MVQVFGRIAEKSQLVKVDAKDRKILALLAEEGRMPASEIAKKTLLSRDAVSYRIDRLQKKGIILTFVPILDLTKFGYYTYHVFMLLDEKTKEKHQALIDFLVKHPNTKALMAYTDTWDVEWTVVAKDIQEFDQIFTDVLSTFPDVILEKEKLAVVKRYTAHHLPICYYQETGIQPASTSKPAKEAKIDDIDVKLLQLLSENARQSSYELGKKLQLSPDSVVYRIRKLVNAQIIKVFSTLLNLSNLNHSWYTYAINFKKFDAKDEAKFNEFVSRHPHIIRAVKLFGEWDVLLSIATESTQNYHATVKEIKNTFSDIIYGYQTWLAHEELVFTPLPAVISLKP